MILRVEKQNGNPFSQNRTAVVDLELGKFIINFNNLLVGGFNPLAKKKQIGSCPQVRV